jgi:hypothetical protein
MQSAAIAENETEEVTEAVVGDFNDLADKPNSLTARFFLFHDPDGCTAEGRQNLVGMAAKPIDATRDVSEVTL